MTESYISNPSLSQEQQSQPIKVEIQRLCVKEQSCKVPHGNQAFQIKGQPETSTEININSQPLEKGVFEVTLHLTFTTKFGQRALCQVDVQQPIVIKVNSIDAKLLMHLVNIAAPTLLYPYIRQVFADMIYHAGFQAVFLCYYMDFQSMYQQWVQAKDTETLEKIKASATRPPVTEEVDVTVH